MKKLLIPSLLLSHLASAQQNNDSVNVSLNEIQVVYYKTMNGIGRIKETDGLIIYTGKKNEVIIVDTLEANKAINNTRQIIGRIPGVNIIETESGGFTANGIGFRGINPYQSIETNTRQNGYNISADIYGYNEAYYLPPMEAVKSITFLRGASALAFGPQIGGMINYELKKDAQKPIEILNSQTIGNYGLFSNFTSINGKIKKLNYYSFLKYRNFDGWRKNSKQTQWSGFGGLQYHFSDKFSVGAEYTLFRNLIQMPGGLNDSLFKVDSQQSLRSRNWLQTPWNIVSAYAHYNISENTGIHFTSSYSFSKRVLVWRDESIPPQEKDTIGTNYSYEPREIVTRAFNNFNNELRFLHQYKISQLKQTLNIGLKYAYSYSIKKEAEADREISPNFSNTTDWVVNMNYQTTNIAAYIENNFNIKNKLFVSPGIRMEYLTNTLNGYNENDAEDSNEDKIYVNKNQRNRQFILMGLALQYNFNDNINVYANYQQSYRPLTYSNLTPFGTVAKIDPQLKDPSADNIDIGIRGTIKNIVNFDISGFYLNYKNKIGTVIKQDTINYYFRTNTGGTEHKGIESYIEINILDGLIPTNKLGKLSIYNSYAYIYAQYISGKYAGNSVEYAPTYIQRVGLNYTLKRFSFNCQYSYTSSFYTDAGNTKFDPNGIKGTIPEFSVIDLSASIKINKRMTFSSGINNLTNAKYFTLRTDEYPGPGILPSIGTMFYGSLSLQL